MGTFLFHFVRILDIESTDNWNNYRIASIGRLVALTVSFILHEHLYFHSYSFFILPIPNIIHAADPI